MTSFLDQRVDTAMYRMVDPRYQIVDTEDSYRIPDTGWWLLDTGYRKVDNGR